MRRLADHVRALLALLGPLGAGSGALLERLLGRFGWKVVIGGALLGVYGAVRYRTWFVWMLVAWCAAAWMHAPARADEGAPDEPCDTGEELPVEAPTDPLPAILWDLIGDAPGVHLKTVVQHLHETGQDTACDKAAVKAALDRRGITYKPSVRDAAGRVNEGVHRDDLKAWEEARSPAAPVPLSKVRSNPVATALTSHVAAPATGVATPPTAHE